LSYNNDEFSGFPCGLNYAAKIANLSCKYFGATTKTSRTLSMGKGEPTLFEKLETESEKTSQEELWEGEGLRYALWVRLSIAALTTVCCSLVFPTNFGALQQVSAGSDWQYETLIAEYSFPIYKPQQQYSTECLAAREHAPVVFTPTDAEQRTMAIIQHLLDQASATTENTVSLEYLSTSTINLLQVLPPTKRGAKLRTVCVQLQGFQRAVYDRGFINVPRSFIKTREALLQRSPSLEQVLSTNQLVDSATYRVQWERLIEELFDETMVAIANDLRPMLGKPNLQYSHELTEAVALKAEQSVPKTMGIVRKGETIVAKGERITEATLQKLRSSEYTRFLYTRGGYNIPVIVGNLLHASFIYGLLFIYLLVMRKQIYYDNTQLLGISLPLIVVALMAWWSTLIPSALPLQYLIMAPVLSMLVAILFDSRTTFTITVAMALMVAGVRNGDYTTGLGIVLAGTFAGYTVRDLRNRTQLFKSIAFIFAGYAAPIVAFGIRNAMPINEFALHVTFAAISAIISPILTLGLLFVIERLLNITTDLRLLEYDNVNHPLLTELNQKAPGTYQHTLMVARLAEAAAVAVGANPILVKVGAYFHDIGKMLKAEYFVENQINVTNKHDRIPPAKSASIIRQHIQEGLELAKDYKLPQRIVDFIPMHHGTMLIKYFYGKALDDVAEKGGEVDEEDFRYPGPKPNSKETGILMLADAVEAVSHTIDTNDRDELESVVESIIEERLLDKQLDECDLTMRDLHLIKESFVKNLLGTGHQRVKYKPLPKEESKEDKDEYQHGHQDEPAPKAPSTLV
jgi:putative nucleotidyltransferase with HDIG domain